MKDYPGHPRLAVSCCIVRDRSVLLVRRARPPAAGRWAFPGGTVDLGETMADAVAREVREETGLVIGPPRFVMHHEMIEETPRGVRWHYVIASHAARCEDAAPVAGDDAAEARFVPFDDLGELDVIDTNLDTLRALGHHLGARKTVSVKNTKA